MSKRNQTWDNFKEKEKKKRMGRKGEDTAGPSGSGLAGTLTVQRLSSAVEGKCQKYSRIGPLALISIQKEATLENIKEACKLHFGTDMECDVLAGERGPSFSDASQIQNWKVIHVRFIESTASSTRADAVLVKSDRKNESPTKSDYSTLAGVPSVTSVKSVPVKAPFKMATEAVSVSLSQMLKLGKLILPEVDIVTVSLEEFSVSEMKWLEPNQATFSLQRKSFASGAFRGAFMAKAISGLLKGKYVLKKYKQSEVQGIETLFGTTEKHTRKSVQMSALARNFAKNMELEVPLFKFGQTFTYEKVYFASLNGEFVTIESYLEGDFVKYINNTGDICGDSISEICLKAETFVHYTHQKSNGQLMVTDIQGANYSLCDPEIATSTLTQDDSILFCCGNLATEAINKFKCSHSCNKYCRLLNLTTLERPR